MLIADDLKDLNKFVHDEFFALKSLYGAQNIPPKTLKAISSGVLKRRAIYSKLIHKMDKYRAKIDWALFKMPHCWLWKIFHSRLWYHVKKRLEEESDELKDVPEESFEDVSEVLPPTVVKTVDVPAMSYPSSMDIHI